MRIIDLKNYALAHHIPIITDEALAFISTYIKEHQVKTILEIGGAIGYSAICFSMLGTHVDTCERDEMRFIEAIGFINEFNASVSMVKKDALLEDVAKRTYDLIFIDAAKAQYEKFFIKYEKYLNPRGVIICDNLNFHHLKPEEVSRSTRQLLRKIESFKVFLKENERFETTFYDLGDGLSISRKVV